MPEPDQIIETYVQHVLRLQQEHQNAPLSVEEIEKLPTNWALPRKIWIT
ncbi:MAG: hypothetical protein HC880_07455 [Bacteroidia bacterium]|nr:hypothetical protein [Bacteroidia bacterium]